LDVCASPTSRLSFGDHWGEFEGQLFGGVGGGGGGKRQGSTGLGGAAYFGLKPVKGQDGDKAEPPSGQLGKPPSWHSPTAASGTPNGCYGGRGPRQHMAGRGTRAEALNKVGGPVGSVLSNFPDGAGAVSAKGEARGPGFVRPLAPEGLSNAHNVPPRALHPVGEAPMSGPRGPPWGGNSGRPRCHASRNSRPQEACAVVRTRPLCHRTPGGAWAGTGLAKARLRGRREKKYDRQPRDSLRAAALDVDLPLGAPPGKTRSGGAEGVP